MILKNFQFQFNQLPPEFVCLPRRLLLVGRNFFMQIFKRLLYYELEFAKE